MKWSQLKKRIEATFAPSVVGRIEVWNTRYRGSHDAEGEAWFTLDGKRVWSMGSLSYMIAESRETERIRRERGCADWGDPNQRDGYRAAWEEGRTSVHADGVFAMWDVNNALFEYLNLPIEEIQRSENPIIQAVGMLDERTGKRRLVALREVIKHPLVESMYEVRCEAEGMTRLARTVLNPPASRRDTNA